MKSFQSCILYILLTVQLKPLFTWIISCASSFAFRIIPSICLKLLQVFFCSVLPLILCIISSEYLAIFKKTVAMHEVFLCRVAAHPILRKDLNFHVFLEYNQDVSIELIKAVIKVYF